MMRTLVNRWFAPSSPGSLLRLICRRKCSRLFIVFALLMFTVFTTMHFRGNSKAVHSEYNDVKSDEHVTNEESPFLKNFSKGNRGTTSTAHESTKLEESEQKASCLSWCRRKPPSNGVYFLSAVLLVRIYATDKARLSTRELVQWLYYLSYAGFEQVYVYDSYVFKNESQKQALDFLIKRGFVTYIDWSHKAFPYSVAGTQESAYQHCIDNYGNKSVWQVSIDIDEYPFCPLDVKSNFMQRFIANYAYEQPDVSQITMQNFLFLGKPLDEAEHPLLIDRLRRRTHGVSNNLVKPIYKTKYIRIAGVHHHDVMYGHSEDADYRRIRLNHYWGARLQNWGEDTPETLAKTRPDDSMQEIVDNLLKCDTACFPTSSIIYKFRLN